MDAEAEMRNVDSWLWAKHGRLYSDLRQTYSISL